jgi:hypothetical protein
MKKEPFIIASIRLDRRDWVKFGKIMGNKSAQLRRYIREVVRNELKAKNEGSNRDKSSK